MQRQFITALLIGALTFTASNHGSVQPAVLDEDMIEIHCCCQEDLAYLKYLQAEEEFYEDLQYLEEALEHFFSRYGNCKEPFVLKISLTSLNGEPLEPDFCLQT